jgi:hypothetical protein
MKQVFLFMILAGTAQAENIQMADLGVKGPGGEVVVFYKDGNDVVVRNCGKDYSVVKRREDCKASSPENRVPLESFKRTLQSAFLIAPSDKLKPLTGEEVEAYRKNNPGEQDRLKRQEKELDEKLAKIEEFIKDVGGTDAQSKKDRDDTKQLLVDVRKELAKHEGNGEATRKVNAILTGLINKISSSRFESVSSVKDSDTAMYSLLQVFDATKPECGTDDYVKGYKTRKPGAAPGDDKDEPKAQKAAWLDFSLIPEALAAAVTVEDRIKDCAGIPKSSVKSSTGVTWNLVSRKRDPKSGKFMEVWKDAKSGLLWGDAQDKRYTHYNAIALDSKGKVVSETACKSDEGKAANAQIGEKAFGLPSKAEFEAAEKNGVREVVPNMRDRWFWSASVHPGSSGYAFVFYGNDGYVGHGYRDYVSHFSVRCVGR